MSSTTLMTFLLCTDPSVRFVQLLGSWDNFSKPYAMERDKRVGGGQWRGCHKFTDIPYEGPSNGSNAPSVGLRMGGTYWYYYLLDGDVEYYNEAEPVTTRCPSLPGQPVNVLQVPVILPDSRTHGRDGSVSSQRSNYRTMNPEDKFLNPRQPPMPKVRLRTSPPMPQHPTPEWSFLTAVGEYVRSTSQPASPTRVKGESGRDDTRTKPARSLSPPRSRRVRAAFRHMNASLSDTEEKDCQGAGVAGSSWQYKRFIPNSSGRGRDYGQVPRSANRAERASSANSKGIPLTGELPFRQPTTTDSAGSSPLSIQHRRALKSRPRGDSPNGNVLRLETRSGNGKRSSKHPENSKRSPTAKEAIAQKGSALLLTAKKLSPKLASFKEKRLPTLPNSPSSVMDEALRDIDAQERALDMEMLCSHFSAITTTDESAPSDSPCEKSHFSKWSTDSDTASPESMTSSSTFNVENHSSPTNDKSGVHRASKTPVPRDYHDPRTPHLTADPKPRSSSSLSGGSWVNLSSPHVSISEASPQIDIPDICVDATDQVESNPKRHAAFFGATEPINALGLASPGVSANCDQSRDRFSSTPGDRLSTTMQELMDELGYLGDTIESGDGRI